MLLSQSPEDKMLIDETDEFGNEIPLGKIVQILKSRGAKKTGGKQKAASVPVNTGKDDDVLGLLREINLDNQDNLGESVKSKPKKPQMDMKESNEKPVDFSAPKRKRSVSKSRPHSGKGSKDGDELLVHSASKGKPSDSLENKLKEKRRADSNDKDLVASPTSTKTPVSKGKKDAKSHTEVSRSSAKKYADEDNTMRAAELASLNGSFKRQKPRLVSGLAKCSTHDSSSKDLVGRRIKVWWPLDKEFYPGVVKSYDSAKTLHTVLYDDGDMEQLNMAKEKWKMIESNGSPMKQQKKDHAGSNQGRAQETKSTSSTKVPANQHKSIKTAQETKSTSSTKVPANQHKSVKTAQEMKSTSSTKVPANQHKSIKTPSPLKRKGKPKAPPENKRRKTSGGSKSIEATSEAGVNDSDSASSLAHSDSDKDVKSDGEKDKEVAVGSAGKEKTGKTEKESAEDMELEEKKPDGDSLSCKEESDDETLSVWKKRASQAT
ncbi:unnamed protein product [Triticum turgidum subsp. durum]|uniref:PTM/DIR17-like Tudor domain-containing protein n=1 Tax=Triticum turgidum subsp. durum TaxID=4567 RepID=A0A9R0ZA19_TRITD|nr:unnamed protein product [Triticum turgidum subsp. durum]